MIGKLLIMGASFVAALNLDSLVQHGEYETSWWKVGFCVILIILGMVIPKREVRR